MPVLPELASYLDGQPEPHIVCDSNYRIVVANAAYRRQFGAAGGLVGRTCYEVSHHIAVPCDQAGESCPLARARESGRRERVLHLHHTPRGEEYVDIELALVRDERGEPVYFVEKMAPLEVAHGRSDARGLVGRAPAFQRVLQLVSRVARSEAAVLITGESGSGKELVARAIHDASERASRPLVVVDCSGLPETLFESELFGHERGAFTGAHAQKAGLVESASGGTLFLDELGDIPLALQVKLLRLLESGTYRRVGSTELRRADVRIVSATHRDLGRAMAEGRFRADLYWRLSTFPIALPALRERRDDIALLAEALLARLRPKAPPRLAPAALRLLREHDWPGNVRELRNLLERACLLCDGDLLGADEVAQALAMGRFDGGLQAVAVPGRPGIASAAAGAGGGQPAGAGAKPAHADATGASAAVGLRALEAEALRARVLAHRGTRDELAAELGVSPRTLYRRLRALGLDG